MFFINQLHTLIPELRPVEIITVLFQPDKGKAINKK